jgi:hypothetical protein
MIKDPAWNLLLPGTFPEAKGFESMIFRQAEHPMPAEPRTPEDMFVCMLKDFYHAEKQILNALPKMAKAD